MSKKQEIENQKIGFFQKYSSGQTNLMPNGVLSINGLKQMLKNIMISSGYEFVSTPTIVSNELWKKTGHLDKFKDNMFSIEESDCSLKPMNCPLHALMFKRMFKQRKKLPIKLSEFSLLFRKEATGALNGFFRLSRFTQDDSHVFCKIEHIDEIVIRFIKNLQKVFKYLNLSIEEVHLSGIDEEYFIGNLEEGKMSEKIIEDAARRAGVSINKKTKDGAFYGPKLDFHVKDENCRLWQCSTLQVDLCMPKNLELPCECVIHHAILGTFERMFGIILDNLQGRSLPFLINPTKVFFISAPSINDKAKEFIRKIVKSTSNIIGREYIKTNFSKQDISEKLKKAILSKAYYIAIIGNKESELKTITIKSRNIDASGNLSLSQNVITFEDFIKLITKENKFNVKVG